MSFFAKYLEGYREVIKSIDDSKRSQFQKGIGKFFATLKVVFDMVFTVAILLVASSWLVGMIL
ncbi:MAG: hypothetical protein VYC33_03275 [Candidatus Thermoplasmatota archaeon]|nr:hypothetical protein [Candidatus Thermoplasmatota archaeon]